MAITPQLLPDIIRAITEIIEANAEEITELDQAIGDGDHVYNLQRGLDALNTQSDDLSQLEWPDAFQKTGMILMSKIGGASGSLFGTLFIAMSKAARGHAPGLQTFAEAFVQGVEAVKKRGKADAGEKTMLDVLIPVAESLQQSAQGALALPDVLSKVDVVAIAGMEATRDMVATKGRASFLGERSKGHIDAGAKTSQLMIGAIVSVLTGRSTPPS